MTTIVVTGGRAHPEPKLVVDAFVTLIHKINDFFDDTPDNWTPHLVRHGACPTSADDLKAGRKSVDETLDEYMRQYPSLYNVDPHPADWRTHGAWAGPVRNREMAALGADYGLAFPTESSRGTWGCVKELRAVGIPTLVLEQEDLYDFGWMDHRIEEFLGVEQ